MYLTVGEFVNLQLNSMYQLAMNLFRNKQNKSLSIVIYHKQVEHEVDIYLIMCNLTYVKIEINDGGGGCCADADNIDDNSGYDDDDDDNDETTTTPMMTKIMMIIRMIVVVD